MAPNSNRDEDASSSGKVRTDPFSKKSFRRPSLRLLTKTIEAARSAMPTGPSGSGSSHGGKSYNNTSNTSASGRSQDDPFSAYDDPSSPGMGSAPVHGGVYSPLVIHKELTSASAESAPADNLGARRVNTNLSSSFEPSMRARRFSSLPVSFGAAKKDASAFKTETKSSSPKTRRPLRVMPSTLPLDPKRDWFFCIPVLRQHADDSSKYCRVGVTLLHCRGPWPLRQINISQNKPAECIAARTREDAMKMVGFGTRELARYRQLAMSRWDFEQVWDAYANPGGRDVSLASLFRLDTSGGYYGREPGPQPVPQYNYDTVYENADGDSKYGSATSVQIDEVQPSGSVTIEMEPMQGDPAPATPSDRGDDATHVPVVIKDGSILVLPDDTPMKAWKRLDRHLLTAMTRTLDPEFAEQLAGSSNRRPSPVAQKNSTPMTPEPLAAC
eukprot:comp22977_c0_seq1/m.36547 comp22977_c0_seq1/g.36547  ORF comp22977_c0_seq1/g.36547 comp22977_c0_seq1/m.36547 type:complete len:442 (-) comp22977_c0_seq1:57-1382(-)